MNAFSIRQHISATLSEILSGTDVASMMKDETFVSDETDRVLSALRGVDENDLDATATALRNYSVDLAQRVVSRT